MCYKPFDVEIKYRDMRPGSPRTTFAHCNECEECRKERSLNFSIRAYYDYLYCIKNNGFVFFDTLTYDEKFVPRTKINGIEVKYFRDDDVKMFKKKFEILAMKMYSKKVHMSFNAKNRDTIFKKFVRENLKVLLAAEFGGKTHRVHYHPLVFCSTPLFTAQDVEELVMRSWTVDKACTYMLGGVEDIAATEKVVRNFGKLMYVSGYLNKDDYFSKYIQSMIGVSAWRDMDYKERRKYQPTHYIYQGFGKHLFDMYSKDSLIDTSKVKIPDGAGGFKFVSVPQYYIRKICYDIYKSVVIDEKNSTLPKFDFKGNVTNSRKVKFKFRVDYQYRLNEYGSRWYSKLLRESICKKLESNDKIYNNATDEERNYKLHNYVQYREPLAVYQILCHARMNCANLDLPSILNGWHSDSIDFRQQIEVVSDNFLFKRLSDCDDFNTFHDEEFDFLLSQLSEVHKNYGNRLFFDEEFRKVKNASERFRLTFNARIVKKKKHSKLKFLKDLL